MMRTSVLILCLSLFAAACGETSAGDQNINNSDAVSDTGGNNTDIGGEINFDSTEGCPTADDPGGDLDGDGIPNGFEDKNLDCILDAGETNPTSKDTDGDGLEDGDEDINRNGVYDAELGELDPTSKDSDGDGVPDGQDPRAVVCNTDLVNSVDARPAAPASSNLALPSDYTIANESGAAGARFSNITDNVFGYVVKTTGATSVAAGNGANISAVIQGGNQPVNEFAREFMTWSTAELPARPAIRNQLFFDTTKNPAQLRDEILGAISGAAINSGESGTSCSSGIQAYQMAELRADGSLVTVGALTCRENLSNSPELQFLFTDVIGGTILAPGNFNPDGFRCESLTGVAGGKVDFLWVIDSSLSMGDEQQNVAATATRFLDTLQRSGVDWRVGVTTTSFWLMDFEDWEGQPLGEDPTTYLDHDELLDYCSGLRGLGFISSASGNVGDLFTQYVTFDQGCRDGADEGLADLNANVCGVGVESGLASAVGVIDRTTPGISQCNANRQLRGDAETVVVIVSDEEDFVYKDRFSGGFETVLPPNDPERTTITNAIIDAFNQVEIPVFSIVGDQGSANGGTCPEFDGLRGAEYGLGYIEVATGTGGAFGSVCNSNLQTTIDAIIAAGIGAASNFTLTEFPITPSIRVAVNGALVPRSRNNGWDYDADANSIVFFRAVTENDVVTVGYKTWVPIGG